MALATKHKRWILFGSLAVVVLVAGIFFCRFWFSGDNPNYVRQRLNSPENQAIDLSLTFETAQQSAVLQLPQKLGQYEIETSKYFLLFKNSQADGAPFLPEGARCLQLLVTPSSSSVFFDYLLNGVSYATEYHMDGTIDKFASLMNTAPTTEVFSITNQSDTIDYIGSSLSTPVHNEGRLSYNKNTSDHIPRRLLF